MTIKVLVDEATGGDVLAGWCAGAAWALAAWLAVMRFARSPLRPTSAARA